MRKHIAVDLGSQNTYISLEGKVVVNEPTVVAISSSSDRIVAVGKRAYEMLGKTPESLNAVTPVRSGVIADFVVSRALLKIHLGRFGSSFQLLRPDCMYTVPAGSTSVERRAMLEVALEAGSAHAYIVDAPLVAAIGAGVAVSGASGNVVLHMGAEVTEAAVISLGGIVSSFSKRIGGNSINEAIKDYLREEENLVIGDLTAEDIKKTVVSATIVKGGKEIEVSGRDLVFGLPRNITVSTASIHEAVEPVISVIASVVESALEKTPPELASDVIDKGIVLTGGGAYLTNFDKYLTLNTGIPAHIAEDPEYCAVRGAAVVLDNLQLWKRSVTTKS